MEDLSKTNGRNTQARRALRSSRAMRGASLFSDQKKIEDYIDMVLRNAKILAGIELAVKGDTIESKASAFLDSLTDHHLAKYVEEKAPPVSVPPEVWKGLEAVRISGATNMLDRPAVIEIAAHSLATGKRQVGSNPTAASTPTASSTDS